ncbi:MAG: protein TolR [Gammaproteobacteria bacterium]|nr:protein TolR [Gammaproteobacteria bacterium]
MSRPKRRPISDINVVPYIDVMLVMLVIFMITAPLLKTGVEVELPQASAEPIKETPSEPLVLSVNAEGEYFLSVGADPEAALDEQALMALVAAVIRRDPKKSVLVRGDRSVDYGRVVRAMALLQAAGVPQVGLLTESLN